MSDERSPLSRAIRDLRRRLGLTQRAFAERLGVPQSSIYRWESSLVTPSGKHLKSMHELAELHGFEFQPFQEEVEPPDPSDAKELLSEAALKLLREQLAFCESLEGLRNTPEGAEIWGILEDTILTQRKKLARFLDEMGRRKDRDFNFWKAVSVLKVFSWREGARSDRSPKYVLQDQMTSSPDTFGVRRK